MARDLAPEVKSIIVVNLCSSVVQRITPLNFNRGRAPTASPFRDRGTR
jgi:hypothetical protein